MLMAIFLVYSTFSITSGKKSLSRAQNGGHFENIDWTQLQFNLGYEESAPNYGKKVFFMVMTSSMTSQGGLKIDLYIHV